MACVYECIDEYMEVLWYLSMCIFDVFACMFQPHLQLCLTDEGFLGMLNCLVYMFCSIVLSPECEYYTWTHMRECMYVDW